MDKNTYLVELSESERTDFGRTAFRDQSPEQRVFSAVYAAEGEINSGGFESYFSGWLGDTANYASDALEAVGAPVMASIARRALEIAGGPLPEDDDQRTTHVGELEDRQLDQLMELDDEFMEYPENLTNLLFAFVEAHPEAFGAVPASE